MSVSVDIDKIIELVKKGFSGADISEKLGVSRQTIYRRVKNHNPIYKMLRENAVKKQADVNYKDGRTIYDRFKKNICEKCGIGGRLECHHRDPVKYSEDYGKIIEGDHSKENIMTLCSSCHKKEHVKMRKIEKNGEKKC